MQNIYIETSVVSYFVAGRSENIRIAGHQISTINMWKYPEDALHISAATVNEIEFIVTWNFKHINNPFMKNKIREIIENAGYKCPIICSPEELLGENDE